MTNDADIRALFLDDRTILRVEVGSTAHGVTHQTNDHDEIAVYVPPAVEMLGLERPEHLIYRPGRGPHDPSGPGDLDRTYYSLRKFVGLLVKGNPSVLYVLHGPQLAPASPLGVELREAAGAFRNDHTRRAYLGYAQAQRERIQGVRGAAGRMRRSPEGGGEVDYKYAMHMVRLGIQGYEYLTTGTISSPSLQLDLLLSIRAGEVSIDDIVALALHNEALIKALDLPTTSGRDWSEWLANAHRSWWYASLSGRRL